MPDRSIDDCGESIAVALAEPARPSVRDLFDAGQLAASGPHRAPVRAPTPLRPDRRAPAEVRQPRAAARLAGGLEPTMPNHQVRWDGHTVAEQTSDPDPQALATLLTRVAQTTLEVVAALISDQAETGSSGLPAERLTALADEFGWVGDVLRRNAQSTKPDGGA